MTSRGRIIIGAHVTLLRRSFKNYLESGRSHKCLPDLSGSFTMGSHRFHALWRLIYKGRAEHGKIIAAYVTFPLVDISAMHDFTI